MADNRMGLGDGAWLMRQDQFLGLEEADALMRYLLEVLVWERQCNEVRGEHRPQARRVAWAGELPYRYSGRVLEPRSVPEGLERVWARVEAACGQRFNHVVVNRYADGSEHLARHADNEPELGRNPTIAGLSLGAGRRFQLARRRGGRVRTVPVRHGQLLVMGGTCQHTWLHGLPPAGPEVGERVHVTFRWLHGPPGWRAPGDPRSPS